MEAYFDHEGYHVLFGEFEYNNLKAGKILDCNFFCFQEQNIALRTGKLTIMVSDNPLDFEKKADRKVIDYGFWLLQHALPTEKEPTTSEAIVADAFLTIPKEYFAKLLPLKQLQNNGKVSLLGGPLGKIIFSLKPLIPTKGNPSILKITKEFDDVKALWSEKFKESINQKPILNTILAEVNPTPEEGQWYLVAPLYPNIGRQLVKISSNYKMATSWNKIDLDQAKLYEPIFLSPWEAKKQLEENIKEIETFTGEHDKNGFYQLALELMQDFYQKNFVKSNTVNPENILAQNLKELDVKEGQFYSVFWFEKRYLVAIEKNTESELGAITSSHAYIKHECLLLPILLNKERALIHLKQEILAVKTAQQEILAAHDEKENIDLDYNWLEMTIHGFEDFRAEYLV